MSDTTPSTSTDTKIEPKNKKEKLKMYNQVYYQMNKEKISQQAKEKYKENEEFRNKKRVQALKYYHTKKVLKKDKNTIS